MKKTKIIINSIKAIYNYHQDKTKISNLPTLLWIEPTNKCNINCIMCPNSEIPKDKLGFMEWDVYTKIIDEIKDYASSIYLLIAGESLLHKDIYKMIKYASDRGIRVLMNTNGTVLVQRDNIKKLLEAEPEHITFALDGYNAETYEKIRRGAKFNQVIPAIIDLLKAKKEQRRKKPYIAITTLLVGKENYQDKEKAKHNFKKLFKDLPVNEFIIKQCNSWGNVFKNTNEFTYQKFEDKKTYPCGHLWSTVSIRWDGTVIPCCFDFFNGYILGDVKEKRLKEIWNDQPMIKLRKAMIENKATQIYPLCDGCIIRNSKPVFGIPAGMRSAIGNNACSVLGNNLEKIIIKLAKKISPSFPLEIDSDK
ncbi:radical SAM protein [Patescibacteria group bacterium]|nr:radical SAM protein [Patescibacteria group bacterium]